MAEFKIVHGNAPNNQIQGSVEKVDENVQNVIVTYYVVCASGNITYMCNSSNITYSEQTLLISVSNITYMCNKNDI